MCKITNVINVEFYLLVYMLWVVRGHLLTFISYCSWCREIKHVCSCYVRLQAPIYVAISQTLGFKFKPFYDNRIW